MSIMAIDIREDSVPSSDQWMSLDYFYVIGLPDVVEETVEWHHLVSPRPGSGDRAAP